MRTESRKQSTEPIAAANYVARAQAHIRSCSGEGAIIHHPSPQWSAWMTYFDRLGYRHKYADSKGVYTVPAAFPAMFDPTADGDPGRFDLGEAATVDSAQMIRG